MTTEPVPPADYVALCHSALEWPEFGYHCSRPNRHDGYHWDDNLDFAWYDEGVAQRPEDVVA